jgi:hypothetical protein
MSTPSISCRERATPVTLKLMRRLQAHMNAPQSRAPGYENYFSGE